MSAGRASIATLTLEFFAGEPEPEVDLDVVGALSADDAAALRAAIKAGVPEEELEEILAQIDGASA